MSDIIILGIGNPFRGDDAAGFAVIDRLEGKVKASVDLKKQRGDVSELLDVFAGYKTVYIVDACCADAAAGTWERIDGQLQPLPAENTQTSTHGLGVSQAMAIAKNLGSLPAKLIIYGINGDNFTMNDAMTPAVAQAVEKVAEALLQEEDISHA